jgi:hypothetical protein
MSDIIWQSPVPSTAFFLDVSVQIKPGREIVLTFKFEDEKDQIRTVDLIFRDVVHYRTTYLPALRSQMIVDAYDKVVDLGNSDDLIGIASSIKENGWRIEITHYRVCFDDGPCFDFFASGFEEQIL